MYVPIWQTWTINHPSPRLEAEDHTVHRLPWTSERSSEDADRACRTAHDHGTVGATGGVRRRHPFAAFERGDEVLCDSVQERIVRVLKL